MTSLQKEAYKPHRMGDHSDTNGCSGDDDPCYCNEPKDLSLQKESEWEKEFDENFPLSFFADQGLVGSGFSEIDFTLWTQEATKRTENKRLHIKSFIREFIYQREQEIAEEVEAMLLDDTEIPEEYRLQGFLETHQKTAVMGHNSAVRKVLSIIEGKNL